MNRQALRLQRLMLALGEPSRFRIVQVLGVRTHHVSELAGLVELSQSCTTRHLQALRRLGLVRTHREGKRVIAELTPESAEAEALLEWLHGAGLEARPSSAPPRRSARRPAAPRAKLPGAIAEDRPHAPPVDSGKSPEPAPSSDAPPKPAWAELEDFLL